MLTYELKKAPGLPLYESLYRCIRADILSGKLQPGQKLPSKRALSQHLKVSKITVEGAYDQLLSEGFIRSREKVGYFVEGLGDLLPPVQLHPQMPEQEPAVLDLTGGECTGFPFSVWSRLQRQVLSDLGQELIRSTPRQGVWQLRQAIAEHLLAFRGMPVEPEQVLIGAGTDFLYNLLVQLLGADKVYGLEEPGYSKIRRIYAAAGAVCENVTLDSRGVKVPKDRVQVLHISPNHHFPTGKVTDLSRRQQLLQWANAAQERWIVEDDYDSEFRFDAHPMPPLQSLPGGQRVIYMNTFSRSLSPAIRIGYMVLPRSLTQRFRQQLGFYGCTVSSFEQYTLARFLQGDWFEKHINRMRRVYRQRRNALLEMIRSSPFRDRVTVLEEDAGLHFLLRVDTDMTDEALVALCRRGGVGLQALSSFYHGSVPEQARHCLLIHYAGLSEEQLQQLQQAVKQGLPPDFPL